MFNILLDDLPTSWNGYPIDSDFQTGIQICQLLADADFTNTERAHGATRLLFPEEIPPVEESLNALEWFLNEFNHDNHGKETSNIKIMDWDIDQWRIYSAFLTQYGIDLNQERMHWFTFMGLISCLEECAFTRVMEIRKKKVISKMSQEEKLALKKAKQTYQIVQDKKEEAKEKEDQAVEMFNRLRGR